MKLKYLAAVTTGLVITVGFAIISPIFLRSNENEPRVMLSFSVVEPDGAVEWCQDLSSLLDAHDIGASVFVAGNIAEQYPDCVSCFGEKVDIGTQGYSNTDLTKIPDYSIKLQEVTDGKAAVDDAGNLYTRVFRAPFGATDQDIYSLLSRSDILADLSYENQYNVYHDGQFVKYAATTYKASDFPPDFFLSMPETTKPVIIFINSDYLISDVNVLISNLKELDMEFVNASELTGLALTIREG